MAWNNCSNSDIILNEAAKLWTWVRCHAVGLPLPDIIMEDRGLAPWRTFFLYQEVVPSTLAHDDVREWRRPTRPEFAHYLALRVGPNAGTWRASFCGWVPEGRSVVLLYMDPHPPLPLAEVCMLLTAVFLQSLPSPSRLVEVARATLPEIIMERFLL